MVLLMKEYPEHGALTNERTYVKKVSWLMFMSRPQSGGGCGVRKFPHPPVTCSSSASDNSSPTALRPSARDGNTRWKVVGVSWGTQMPSSRSMASFGLRSTFCKKASSVIALLTICSWMRFCADMGLLLSDGASSQWISITTGEVFSFRERGRGLRLERVVGRYSYRSQMSSLHLVSSDD